MSDILLLNLSFDEVSEWPMTTVVETLLQYQEELKKAHMQLALTKASLATATARIKEKNRAIRNLNGQRKSLKQTVRRRRKYGK